MKKNWYMITYVLQKLCCFVLSNCLNAKKKNTIGLRNIQYSIALSVHGKPSVFNTTYTIKRRVNCPNIFKQTPKMSSSKTLNKKHFIFKILIFVLFKSINKNKVNFIFILFCEYNFYH